MLYAYTTDGSKILPNPGMTGFCDYGHRMIPKCGTINEWHWAHEKNCECEPWSEHESKWHLDWKGVFPSDCVEVTIKNEDELHRADIITPAGTVIELQHSSISSYDIIEREIFYQDMMWIFDVKEPYQGDRLEFNKKEGFHTFRWKNPRKHIATANKRVLLDIGTRWLFELKRIYTESPCGGWGKFILKDRFIEANGGIVRPKQVYCPRTSSCQITAAV